DRAVLEAQRPAEPRSARADPGRRRPAGSAAARRVAGACPGSDQRADVEQAGRSAPLAEIRVDPARQIGTVDRRIFGGFVEHLGRCIYGGIFDEGSPLADEHGFRRDVLAAAGALRMPLLRWPGGNFVSGYHWTDGIGPRDRRPRKTELAWF